MGIVRTVLRAVIWWDSETLNTQFYTWRKGVKVGEDEQGNVFYLSRKGDRRWVIFNGEAEATRIAPDWHGWLHHLWDQPPNKAPLVHRDWELPVQENLTGTARAYVPSGSLRRAHPIERCDYDAWQPE